MSSPDTEREVVPEPPHPRQTMDFFGHAEAEQALLENYRSGRAAHAWLIGGPAGIGKATLAYRMARFVLAHRNPGASAVQAAKSLALDAGHPVARRVAAQAHSDLLVLERTIGDTGKMRTEIAVDDVRRTITFFGSTAGEGGWRVCIVDSADELNRAGANALLKILEEPPSNCLLIVVSHAPSRLLPTIRSRCRKLMLRPLAQTEVIQAAAAALGRDVADDELRRASLIAEGSVARCIGLAGGPLADVRERSLALLAQLPAVDARALHAFGDSLERTPDAVFETFLDTARDWLSARIKAETGDLRRLARVAEVWEKLNRAAQEVEVFNLERKPMVFAVFGLLAETVRR